MQNRKEIKSNGFIRNHCHCQIGWIPNHSVNQIDFPASQIQSDCGYGNPNAVIPNPIGPNDRWRCRCAIANAHCPIGCVNANVTSDYVRPNRNGTRNDFRCDCDYDRDSDCEFSIAIVKILNWIVASAHYDRFHCHRCSSHRRPYFSPHRHPWLRSVWSLLPRPPPRPRFLQPLLRLRPVVPVASRAAVAFDVRLRSMVCVSLPAYENVTN